MAKSYPWGVPVTHSEDDLSRVRRACEAKEERIKTELHPFIIIRELDTSQDGEAYSPLLPWHTELVPFARKTVHLLHPSLVNFLDTSKDGKELLGCEDTSTMEWAKYLLRASLFDVRLRTPLAEMKKHYDEHVKLAQEAGVPLGSVKNDEDFLPKEWVKEFDQETRNGEEVRREARLLEEYKQKSASG